MQALLRVAPEEMRRICKTHPAILMRDHTHLASFITHLSTHLQTPPVSELLLPRVAAFELLARLQLHSPTAVLMPTCGGGNWRPAHNYMYAQQCWQAASLAS